MNTPPLDNSWGNFFNNYICSPSGGSPEICAGGSQWLDGAGTIATVVKGSLNMWSGSFKMAYGAIALPFRFVNELTGGLLFGKDASTANNTILGTMGVLGGSAWILSSPIRFLNLLIGGTVSAINVLHDTHLLGGPNSILPRFTPLNIAVMVGLYFYLFPASSSNKSLPPKLSIEEIIEQVKLERLEKLEETAKVKKFVVPRFKK